MYDLYDVSFKEEGKPPNLVKHVPVMQVFDIIRSLHGGSIVEIKRSDLPVSMIGANGLRHSP